MRNSCSFLPIKNNHAMLKPTLIGMPVARIKPTFSKNIKHSEFLVELVYLTHFLF